jgi:hypothetical protein
MITKAQLRELVDSNKRFTWTHIVPWNETHLARLYDAVDAQIEGGSLIDIVSARPVNLDEKETILVEMVLDCSDLFEDGEKEHLCDGE